eukprot:5322808-Alexandrium_andersonii.AAC.1
MATCWPSWPMRTRGAGTTSRAAPGWPRPCVAVNKVILSGARFLTLLPRISRGRSGLASGAPSS